MVANSDLPYFLGVSRHRGRGNGALAQSIGRRAILFLLRYVFPAPKSIGADWRDIAAPEIGKIFIGRNKLKSASEDVEEILRKPLGGGKKSSKYQSTLSNLKRKFSKLKWSLDQPTVANFVKYTTNPGYFGQNSCFRCIWIAKLIPELLWWR